MTVMFCLLGELLEMKKKSNLMQEEFSGKETVLFYRIMSTDQ